MNKTHWSDGLLLWVCEAHGNYRAILDGGIMASLRQSDDGWYRMLGSWGAGGRYHTLDGAMTALQAAFEATKKEAKNDTR